MQVKNFELMDRIVDYIDQFQDEHGGSSPSVQEIADALGSTKGTISKNFAYMESIGRVERQGTRNIVTEKSRRRDAAFAPLVGSIRCGEPNFAEENIVEYIPIPASFKRQGLFYFLRAKGDSMTNAGIDDGDLVLIREQNDAGSGQIVVALVGSEEATLKRYYPNPETGMVVLRPENDAFESIEVDLGTQEFSIQGVAEYTVKKI